MNNFKLYWTLCSPSEDLNNILCIQFVSNCWLIPLKVAENYSWFLGAVSSFQLCRGHDPWSRTPPVWPSHLLSCDLPSKPPELWLTLETFQDVTYPRNRAEVLFLVKNNPSSFKLIVRCETIFSGRVIDKIMAEVTKQHNPLLEIIYQWRKKTRNI